MKEINDLMNELQNDLDRVLTSTEKHTFDLLRKELPPFTAVVRCDLCNKEEHYSRMDDLQYENNDLAKSAALLNSVTGLMPNDEKINALTKLFHQPNTTEEQKIEIQKLVNDELYNYPKHNHVCQECALNLQKLFRHAVDLYVSNLASGKRYTKFESIGLTGEEKQALTASTTETKI